MFARSLTIAAVATVLLTFATGPANATEHGPDAIVVSSDDDIVAVVMDREDAPDVYERTVLASPMERLTLEYVYRSFGSVSTPPDDPSFSQQWNLDKLGVPSSWAYADGSDVVVAVLDSAVNFTGSDGFCNPVAFPYDAINQTEGVAPLNTTAKFGHGTHVAGTIAQCTNNHTGVAGIAPSATLMPVRVLSDGGVGTTSELARGIDWAVDHGADIINLSLGADCGGTWPSCSDSVVDRAIERAASAGVILVGASGNSANAYIAYPSAHPDVISVGALNSDDAVWYVQPGDGSNQGIALDLMAPGVDIVQETTRFGSYGYYAGTGTSMAAPHVSAAAALVLSVDPTLTAGQVVAILKSTAVDLAVPGFDPLTGWGRIDVAAAVAAALPRKPPSMENPCVGGPCDSVVSVDGGGLWGLRVGLVRSAAVSSFYFGNPGDVPFMGDWDGDGIGTPGLYRQSDGFVYVKNANTQGNADLSFFFGNPGDVPLVGDFDGDGRDSVSIWRPSEARVFVINELGAGGAGLGAADFDFYLGNPGDVPLVGDFDGDGVDTVGLYRRSTGFVHFTNRLATGNADLSFYFGNPGDQILAGDWDGDGDDTVGVYRPANGMLYVNLENTNGAADWEGYIGSYPWVMTAGNR